MSDVKPWFRFYTKTLFNGKVQNLDGNSFKTLINLWCCFAHHGRKLPEIPALAFELRIRESSLRKQLNHFVKIGLIDCTDDTYTPHDWNEWQYDSDVSTDRVRRFRSASATFRERRRNVSETPPETDTDTDTPISPTGDHGFDASEVAARLMGIWPQKRRGSVGLVGAALTDLLGDAVMPEVVAQRLEASAAPYLASVNDPKYVRRLDRWIAGGEWATVEPNPTAKKTAADYAAEAERHRRYREDPDDESGDQ